MLRLPQQMLAATEADFEPDIVDGAGEIRPRIASLLKCQRELRQQCLKQRRLMLRKLRPFAATIELTASALNFRSRGASVNSKRALELGGELVGPLP